MATRLKRQLRDKVYRVACPVAHCTGEVTYAAGTMVKEGVAYSRCPNCAVRVRATVIIRLDVHKEDAAQLAEDAEA